MSISIWVADVQAERTKTGASCASCGASLKRYKFHTLEDCLGVLQERITALEAKS